MSTNSRNKFKRTYIKNKRLFLDFFLHFWKVHDISNIFEKKKSILAQLIQKWWTAKEVFT